jgi:hypothetical protein
MVRLATLGAFAILLGLITPAQAASEDDADWPCAQRRTGPISAAAIWAGPDLAQAGSWGDDRDAAALARKLASRRTPIEEADGLIDAFANNAGPEKDARLTRVFAGMLDIVNSERNRIIAGVVRYGKGQSRLADKIRADADKVGDVEESGDASSHAVDEAQSTLKWDKRIFDERLRALSYVCETPILLERRAFEIGRKIQERL